MNEDVFAVPSFASGQSEPAYYCFVWSLVGWHPSNQVKGVCVESLHRLLDPPIAGSPLLKTTALKLVLEWDRH